MKMGDGNGKIHDVLKCPTTTGLTECPFTHWYSYKQGQFCCKVNIDYDRRNSSHPLLNFDTKTCKDDDGTDRSIACDSPPCVNFGCHRYRCYLENKVVSGGQYEDNF